MTDHYRILHRHHFSSLKWQNCVIKWTPAAGAPLGLGGPVTQPCAIVTGQATLVCAGPAESEWPKCDRVPHARSLGFHWESIREPVWIFYLCEPPSGKKMYHDLWELWLRLKRERDHQPHGGFKLPLTKAWPVLRSSKHPLQTFLTSCSNNQKWPL